MDDKLGFVSVSVCQEEPGFICIAAAKSQPGLQDPMTVGGEVFRCVYWHEFADVRQAINLAREQLDQFLEEGGLFEVSAPKARGIIEAIAFDINPGDMRSSE